MPESAHDKLGQVRKDRIHIKYTVETEGGTEVKTLPFVVGVLGDFSGDATEPLKPLNERKFTQIDRDNFDKVLAGMKPGLTLRVTDTLGGDGAKEQEMNVNLKFESMADFEPASVAKQVPALKKLLDAREKLNQLLTKVERSPKLEELLEQILQNTEMLKKLVEPAGDDPNKEGGS